MALPLAGNISISLSAGGFPCATLTHPRGGSCQIVIPGACIPSWRTADGVERISPSGGKDTPAGGITPCGLGALLPADAWAIETMNGGDGNSPVVVSLFAESRPSGVLDQAPEVAIPGMAPLAARMTAALGANQLSVRIEVAHAGEEVLDATGEMADASADGLVIDCTLRTYCSGQREPSGVVGAPAISAEDAAMEDAMEDAVEEDATCYLGLPELQRAGLRLRLEGFTEAKLAELPTLDAVAPGAFAFDAMAPGRLVRLAQGETVAGGISLEPCA